MFELINVSKKFGHTQVLDNISLSLAPGSRTAIVGPSGSGKTTLLRLIAGFEMPDSGQITMRGTPLFNQTVSVPAHQRKIGFVPQEGALFPHLTVEDNIGWGIRASRQERRKQVDALMDRVSLDRQLARHWPHEISGGQQQRVALARALAQQPALMLLDEPFSALDTGLRAATRKATAELLSQAGVATVLVTHDQNEALSFAEQIAVIRHGQFAQSGTPQAVYSQPIDEETALFLGDALILTAEIANGKARCLVGDVPVDDTSLQGERRIMLRPEQLVITPVSAGESGLRATVLDIDFAGYLSTLTLGFTDCAQTLTINTVTPQLLLPGTSVALKITGYARVFSA